MARFPGAVTVEIGHYKDIFCRSRQNYRLQKQAPALILAGRQQNHVYPGAPVCQDFGNRHFYYTSSVMNCVYDCEYCFLQGMYPSANLVVFTDLEEVFRQVSALLSRHPVYLSVSYNTDLLALEHILGYTGEWVDFAAKHRDLSIEIRTKSADISAFERIRPIDNVIFAWSLSPAEIAKKHERNAPSPERRLACIQEVISRGYRVRLCFDPMLYCTDWKKQYAEMFEAVFSRVPAQGIEDAGIGVFRISGDYMKTMRKQAGTSAVIHFPFENDNGVYHYGRKLTGEMTDFAYEILKRKMPEEKIFRWDQTM